MKDFITVMVSLMGILSGIMLVIGTLDAVAGYSYSQCKSEMARIEYVLPAYRIGCWLGSRP